jgi:putative ABC transport system permease protein
MRTPVTTLLQDLRQAARSLRGTPGASLAALAALAIGIGANTAIFSVVDAVLLRPLPFVEPDRIMTVWQNDTNHHVEREWVSPANFLDWCRDSRTFSRLAAFSERPFNLSGTGEPERLDGQRVSAALFPLLGVDAAIGRTFTPEDDRAGAARVVLLSHGLWERRFSSDPAIVGRPITLDDESVTVVGVMPRSFRFPGANEALWVPLAFDEKEAARRRSLILRVVGRLAPGSTAGEARAEMETIASTLAREYPEHDSGMGATIVPLRDYLAGDVRPALLILLGAVGFVLLIACANIANIQMTRAAARRREMAIRSALGATRRRLVRQLLTESLLLSSCGGVLGAFLALWGVDVLRAGMPAEVPRLEPVGIDGRVLLFTLGLSVLSGILSGVLPALTAARAGLNEFLRDGAHGTAGRASGRTRALLVVGEVAAALVLLAGAGLLVRSFANVMALDPGFRSEHVLTLRMNLSPKRYEEPARRLVFYRRLLERLDGVPGVRAAGLVSFLPMTLKGGSFAYRAEGRPAPASNQEPFAVYRSVTPGFFQAMEIPIERGRALTARDDERAPLVAVISRSMARVAFPGQDPIGRRFAFGVGPVGKDTAWVTVVGTVADVRQFDLDDEPRPAVFAPYAQETLFWYAPRDIVVRADGEPLALAAAVREAVRAVDPDLPVADVRTMEQIVSESVARRRFSMLLLGALAAVAFLLAALGVYGVVACSVAQRTQEIGLRMALGARRLQVYRLVIAQGARLAACGVLLGLGGALVLTRLMTTLLFGVSPADPTTFLFAALALPAAAVLASFVPARRATRVDPMVALRCE